MSVRHNGRTETLAVLPAQDAVITKERFDAINAETQAFNDSNDPSEPDEPLLPQCVVGSTYGFEAVPTDVELGRDGLLYVTVLSGGPGALGPRSKVFRVDRRTKALTEIGSGFAGATDLAVAPDGTVYVAELFGGRISELVNGAPVTVAEVMLPAAVEWAGGKLFATVDVFSETGGSVVSITP